ncbi:MAG: NUDIX domain-containing protein [Termitinemataceae bacterium]
MSLQKGPRSVAGICIRNAQLFIAQRFPGGAMGERWEFPGGKVEPGETDVEALQREYNEEFGISIHVGPCIAQASFEHHEQIRDLCGYLVEILAEPALLTEHTQWRWASLEEINRLPFADSDKKLLPQISNYVHKLYKNLV